MSDSLRPRGLQHARLSCPAPSPRACSNSCPLSQWCHPTFLSSVVPFFSCLQSFPASGSFPMSWLSALGDQNTGASASSSVLTMNIQDWFPLGLASLISLQSRDSQESSLTPQFKSINSSTLSLDSITLCLLSLSTHPQIKVSTKPSVCVWCVCMSLSHTCVLSHSVTKTLTFCNSKDWSLAGSSVPTLLKCIFPTIPLEYSSPFFSNVYCIKQSVNSIGKL